MIALFATTLADVALTARMRFTVDCWPRFHGEHQLRLAQAVWVQRGDTTLERLNALTGLTPGEIEDVLLSLDAQIVTWSSSVKVRIF